MNIGSAIKVQRVPISRKSGKPSLGMITKKQPTNTFAEHVASLKKRLLTVAPIRFWEGGRKRDPLGNCSAKGGQGGGGDAGGKGLFFQFGSCP